MDSRSKTIIRIAEQYDIKTIGEDLANGYDILLCSGDRKTLKNKVVSVIQYANRRMLIVGSERVNELHTLIRNGGKIDQAKYQRNVMGFK